MVLPAIYRRRGDSPLGSTPNAGCWRRFDFYGRLQAPPCARKALGGWDDSPHLRQPHCGGACITPAGK
jgi:hypothetical protein